MLTAPIPANAANSYQSQLSASDRTHAKSAFYFSERENWYEAIQHASRAQNPILRDYLTWQAMLQERNGFDFSGYEAFLKRNPNWPRESRLILRAEGLLFEGDAANLSNAQLLQWFAAHPPISGKGRLVYANALKAANQQPVKVQELIREAWINGDFDITQEKLIQLRYAKTLRQTEHIARIDRLIWEGKYTAAERMLFALPAAEKLLYKARLALATNASDVNGAIARVPANLKNNDGLLYERMKWRQRNGLDEGVQEILLAAPATVAYPEKWWRPRHIQVREALEKGRPSFALKLLSNHGQVDGIGQAEALWLQGWITLQYMEKPQEALGYFTALEKAVSYPVSKSRAQYWMGRSAQAMGNSTLAQKWYLEAAKHNTTFYGQLAAQKLHKNAKMQLPHTPRPTADQLKSFLADPRVKAVYMLAEMGRSDDSYIFIGHLADNATTHVAAQLTAELATAINRQDFGVQASKDVLKNHIVLPQTSYPFYRLTFRPMIEEPLMWAITRQESLFNPTVQSSAGAKGMMQLLPSTAREVARKNDIAYQPQHLENPIYNLRLGNLYLGSMVESFDGSYILAIAAYNAGPGRVRQWISEFGRPGNTPEAAIDWIERIPYSETRNYVQRVLENLQVYRAIVTPRQGQIIQIERDLTR
ncbi:MAG: lytic transglycosylase domain-containing protein [Alphaproteobacteria bacterium]|nr:lytic transglycosylase domain-containing protein [Alphaproteobacteria bacterium]